LVYKEEKKIRAIDEQEYERKRDGIIWKTSYVKLDIMRLIKILPFRIYKFSKVLNERKSIFYIWANISKFLFSLLLGLVI
jgi:hypothetical protein